MSEIKKTVVVCPLDWGLGHATRMVPVVEELLQAKIHVVIAADNRPLAFLKQRFPSCTFEVLPGYRPHYPALGLLMPFKLVADLPLMLFHALKSRKKLKQIVKNQQASGLISDNRYELFLTKTYNVFITHQLHLQTFGWQKIFQPLLDAVVKFFLNKFHEVWIPDLEGSSNLSGKLAHPLLKLIVPQKYIGYLSRFASVSPPQTTASCDLLIILSGPEPQRTMLEKTLTQQALELPINTVLVQGKPGETTDRHDSHLHIYNHLDDTTLAGYIKKAQLVVARPGYSTLMDLACFGKKAAFTPTPGQTEQVYLANRLSRKKQAFSQPQNLFSLREAWETRHAFAGIPRLQNDNQLYTTINHFVDRINF